MKTTRIRKKIKEFLADKPRSTTEILEYINNNSRQTGMNAGSYKVCVWALIG
jgi:hypothetical protein